MAEKPRRFQERARSTDDDGADFEAFVFECFRIAKEEAGFSKRLARGRDGAIDLLDRFTEPGGATIAECKYIGSASPDEATARWGEVAARLNKYLPALHADPAKTPDSPYRGWLDPDRPVARYRFCVTVPMSPGQIEALERRIVADFSKLVEAGVEPLRALAENGGGRVRVLPWDWFDAELNEHPSLAFRWFRGLPAGIERFEEERGAEATFRDFLREDELPYFSRDQYEDRTDGKIERGETELVDALAEAGRQALLITGPGGVGKTRLSWEIVQALQGRGFDVYRLGRSAGWTSVVELVAEYPGNASILMLIDYAEAAEGLDRIADGVAHVLANSGHRLRLVATCRASAANQVRDALGSLEPEEKSLGSARSGEAAYVGWVARSILALEALPHREEIARVCRDVPALAAFAIFLFRRHRAQFDAQFGALHEVGDFDKWAAHRIGALVMRAAADRATAERALARIALSLPMPVERLERLAFEDEASRAVIGLLRDDRWIEREGSHYVAAHDVLADALAARWLLEADNAATDRTLDLLMQAAQEEALGPVLIALERLANYPAFAEVDGKAVVDALLGRWPHEVARNVRLLLSGSLLCLEEKLWLLHESALLSEQVREHRMLDGPLSYVAEKAARQGLNSENCPAVATLVDLLDHATTREQSSNMVLRRAYALDPARFRGRVVASLACFPTAEPTHFLLVQMLRSGEPPESIKGAVRYWAKANMAAWRASHLFREWVEAGGGIEALSEPLLAWIAAYSRTREASHVYKAWLDAGGAIETISEPLLGWIDKHRATPEASHGYRAWLEAGGTIEAVSAPLVEWIAEHGSAPEARYVYDAWLHAGGAIEPVAEPLLKWLAEHSKMPQAQFVYAAWFAAGGGVEAVRGPLSGWIAEHGTVPEARYVYAAWVEAEGATDAVSEPLLAWVAEHGTMPEASHLYEAWLEAGGAIAVVAEPLGRWIGEHGATLEASHVYKAWLDADGSIELVSGPLLEWVAAHGAVAAADFVYKAWLERGGDFEPIREPVYDWVRRWCDSPELVYLSKRLSKMGDLPEPVILAIARWCATFPEDEDSHFRLGALCDFKHAGALSGAGLSEFLGCAAAVVDRKLLGVAAIEAPRLWSICAAIGQKHIFNLNPAHVVRIIAKVVSSGNVFRTGLRTGGMPWLEGTQRLIAQVMLYGLRWGELDIERNAEALRRLALWLEASEADQEATGRLMGRLNAEFPSAAWQAAHKG